MKLKIDREKILPSLSLVSSVEEKSQTLPILANLYLSLQKGTLTMVGTDLEVEITEVVEDVEGEDGMITLSMRKMLDIVRMLPEDATLSLKEEDGKVVITSGRSRYTLRTLSAEEYPRIETEKWEERFKIDSLSLRALVEKTEFAMAVRDVRYSLNGVLFELEKDILRATATDGHRLARTELNIKAPVSEKRQLIVPRKAIVEIKRLLAGDEEAELTVEMNRNHLSLTRGQTVLITKLIDGTFPDVKAALENVPDTVIPVDCDAFMNAMNRVAVLNAADRFRAAKFNIEEGVMRVTASNSDQEEAVEEVAVEYKGANLEIGYNVAYLQDAVRVISGVTVELHIKSEDGICILHQPGDERSTWLVMPLRI